jgi:hypothetical protein
MSYENLRRSAAIICKHVSYPERPILYAAPGAAVDPADSGWQFLCNLNARHDFPSAAVSSLEEVAALDPTVRSILDAEPKMSFERSSIAEPWHLSLRVSQHGNIQRCLDFARHDR